MTTFEFDIAPVRIPCRINGKGYVLEPASAATARAWKAKLLEHAELDDQGRVKKIGPGVAVLDVLLLAGCLKHAELSDTGDVEKVGIYLSSLEVDELPNHATEPLAKRAREISGMESSTSLEKLKEEREELDRKIKEAEEGKDPLLNSPENTTGGLG